MHACRGMAMHAEVWSFVCYASLSVVVSFSRLPTSNCVQAGAIATPLWELSLLARHYHPHVASQAFAQASCAQAKLPLAGSVAAFATSHSTSTGAFNPAPRPK